MSSSLSTTNSPYLSADLDGDSGHEEGYADEDWIIKLLKGEYDNRDRDYDYHYNNNNVNNETLAGDSVPLGLEFENDDAAWIMACTFIIFTMQTGQLTLM